MKIFKRQITVLFLVFSFSLFGQTDKKTYPFPKKNNLQLEFVGQGFFYSLKYERIFFATHKFKIGASAGGAFYGDVPYFPNYSLCTEATGILSVSKSFHIELGLGANRFEYINEFGPSQEENYGTLRIGMRLYNVTEKWFLRMGFTPRYSFTTHDSRWYAGLALGVTF